MSLRDMDCQAPGWDQRLRIACIKDLRKNFGGHPEMNDTMWFLRFTLDMIERQPGYTEHRSSPTPPYPGSEHQQSSDR